MAQFFDLAATDEGTLFFSAPLSVGEEDSRYKVFRVRGGGVELVAEGGGSDPFGPGAVEPLTSGDGRVTGFALNYPCRGGSCGISGLPRTYFQISGADVGSYSFHTLQISRNGRFLLGAGLGLRLSVISLPGLEARSFPEPLIPAGRQSVANDGTALLLDPRGLYLLKGTEPMAGTEGARSGAISPDGCRVAFERTADDGQELVLTGEATRTLARVEAGRRAPWPVNVFSFQPGFANDGTLLYLAPREGGVIQAMVMGPEGEARQLTTVDSGVQRAVLSGDGRMAWVVTFGGELLRVRVADGSVDTVIRRTPFVGLGTYAAMPGSVLRLYGTGLSEATEMKAEGWRLPVSEWNAEGGAMQVPWEFAALAGQTRPLTLHGPESPFLQRLELRVMAQPLIQFERDLQRGGVAAVVHQDFRGLVSGEDPALPGETVHVFARNMGPVEPAVGTGERSPADPVARVVTPMACYLFDGDAARGVAVPFAGLAAGSIGIYQIDVTIPEDWGTRQPALQCVFDHPLRGDATAIDVAIR